jgi:hypothetical protein
MEDESNVVSLNTFRELNNSDKALDMFSPADNILDAIEENNSYGVGIAITPEGGLAVSASFQLDHDDILQLLEAAISLVKENH